MRERNNNIQLLRCIACLMVFFSHIVGIAPIEPTVWGINLNNTPLRLLWGGNAAVVVFFFLSGYFYRCKDSLTVGNYIGDVAKRHQRIYPAFVIVLCFGLFARVFYPDFDLNYISEWGSSFWKENVPAIEYIKNFILLLPSSNTRLIDPVIWTLKIDMRMMMILPFVSCAKRHINNYLLFVFILFACYYIGSFEYLPVFFIGMQLSDYTKKTYIRVGRNGLIAFLVLGIILLDIEYMKVFPSTRLGSYVEKILAAVGTACIVIYCVKGTFPKSWLYEKMVHFGDISYYFYLVHLIVILFCRFLCKTISLWMFALLTFTVSLTISIGLSILDRKIQSIFNVKRKE